MLSADITALSELLEKSAAEASESPAVAGRTTSGAAVWAATPTTVITGRSIAAVVGAHATKPSTAAASATGGGSSSGTAAAAPRSSKDIWDADDIDDDEGDGGDDGTDTRKRPHYDILYKQRVGAEDVYLGLSGKTPMSADCDTMVVKVTLPGAKVSDIELDVKDNTISVKTAEYRLSTYLPFHVRHKEGAAKWDGAKGVLSVTLPIIRPEL